MKKHCLTKILLAIYENNCNRNSQKFSYKFAFLWFRRNQKQESNIQLVGGLVTKNVSDFCLKGVPLSALLQRYTELNRLFREIFKEFFLHVILVRIIVSCQRRLKSANARTEIVMMFSTQQCYLQEIFSDVLIHSVIYVIL